MPDVSPNQNILQGHNETLRMSQLANHKIAEASRSANLKLQQKIQTNSPVNAYRESYLKNKKVMDNNLNYSSENFKHSYKDYKAFMNHFDKDVVAKFWNNEFQKMSNNTDSDFNATKKLLFQLWDKNLKQVHEEWAQKTTNRENNNFNENLDKNLDNLKKLSKELADSDLDPAEYVDFENEAQNEQELKETNKWLKTILKDDNLKKLCDQLGRSTDSDQLEQKVTEDEKAEPESAAKSEDHDITGITISNDLSNAVSSELALLCDSETEQLFALKYVTSSLMTYERKSVSQSYTVSPESKIEQEVGSKGPLIICVDVSGSMCGKPEQVAKAITFFMACRAKAQQRECYLITYKSKINFIDLSPGEITSQLRHFLNQPFQGGIDIEPSLEYALKLLKQDSHKNTDTLIISDFIIRELENKMKKDISDVHNKGNKLYALTVSFGDELGEIKNYFDENWLYDYQNNYVVKF